MEVPACMRVPGQSVWSVSLIAFIFPPFLSSYKPIRLTVTVASLPVIVGCDDHIMSSLFQQAKGVAIVRETKDNYSQ
jgi:hypothetical protein